MVQESPFSKPAVTRPIPPPFLGRRLKRLPMESCHVIPVQFFFSHTTCLPFRTFRVPLRKCPFYFRRFIVSQVVLRTTGFDGAGCFPRSVLSSALPPPLFVLGRRFFKVLFFPLQPISFAALQPASLSTAKVPRSARSSQHFFFLKDTLESSSNILLTDLRNR